MRGRFFKAIVFLFSLLTLPFFSLKGQALYESEVSFMDEISIETVSYITDEEAKGKKGILTINKLTIDSFEKEEFLWFYGKY